MEHNIDRSINRREFIAAGAAAGAAVAAGAAASGATAEEAAWDEEADLVVVGSGTAMFGALVAAYNGKSVVVLEKLGIPGGTFVTSGGVCWVPCNRWLEADQGFTWTEDEAMEYLREADVSHGTTDELRLGFVRGMKKTLEYFEDELGYKVGLSRGYSEYDKAPNSLVEGNSIVFYSTEEEGKLIFARDYYPQFMEQFEACGGKLICDARVDSLIRDESGRIVGVTAQTKDGTIRVGAHTGVLLAAGGFDYDADLRNAFLRGPLFGSKACAGNTGDGLRLGMSVGAGLGCMQNGVGGHVYIDAYDPHDDSFDHCMGYDYSSYRANAYTVLVNKHGRRFCDESTPYSIYPDAVYNYDSRSYGWTNIPGYLIFDQKHVDAMGWPHDLGQKNEEMPEWVKKFDTLEELAAFYGIQEDTLIDEVARYNGFCETGVDLDWGRGESTWAEGRIPANDELPNKALGPVNPHFSEWDCDVLRAVSLLRSCGLSLAQIGQVLSQPYLDELALSRSLRREIRHMRGRVSLANEVLACLENSSTPDIVDVLNHVSRRTSASDIEAGALELTPGECALFLAAFFSCPPLCETGRSRLDPLVEVVGELPNAAVSGFDSAVNAFEQADLLSHALIRNHQHFEWIAAPGRTDLQLDAQTLRELRVLSSRKDASAWWRRTDALRRSMGSFYSNAAAPSLLRDLNPRLGLFTDRLTKSYGRTVERCPDVLPGIDPAEREEILRNPDSFKWLSFVSLVSEGTAKGAGRP